MVLAVVRHAQSIENADKYVGFYQDPRPYGGKSAHGISRNIVGLTPRGFHQSLWLGRILAPLLAGSPSVYTSTYRRAIDTAAIAFPHLDGRIEQTPLLDEQHYGDATYMTKRELFATYPDGADDRKHRKHLWAAPGGESLADGVWQRATTFITSVQNAVASGCPVIAVTHHTTILALRALLEQRPVTDVVAEAKIQKTPNAGIFYYEIRDGEFVTTETIAPPI